MTPCPCSYCKEWRAKIEARIKELELEEHSNYEYKAYQEGGLDELRKLLE